MEYLDLPPAPQLELKNPDDAYFRGLVERGPRFLLPVEVSKVFGPLEANFEAGYWFNEGRPHHERILGLAVGHQFPKFEALAEIYDDVRMGGTQRSTTFDVGGRYEFQFPRNLLFIFMAGWSPGGLSGQAAGQPAFIGYAWLQVQLKHGRRSRAPNRAPRP